MKVLVDTSVWSLALRRRGHRPSGPVDTLKQLIADARVEMIGPIRQEILSGIREPRQFERLRRHLDAFPDLVLTSEDYIAAARYFNVCRSRGIQGSNTDFLICGVAARHGLAIYTTDLDFGKYARYLPIKLHEA